MGTAMTTIQPLGAGNPALGTAATGTSTSPGSREAPVPEPERSEAVQLDAGAGYDRHGTGALPRPAGGTISILA